MRKLLILLLCMTVLLTGCTEAPPEETPGGSSSQTTAATEEALSLAPDFTVYDLEGDPVKLSDFRGKPVILNFWASWCGPCKSEMPEFQEAFETYGQDIHFVIVNLTDGSSETVQTASEYVQSCGYTFPVYYDTSSEAAYAYGVYSIPTTYFIDSEGYAVAYGSGALDLAALRRGIEMITP